MNNLMNIENKNTLTSLDVAEITGKEHNKILRDIRDEMGKLEKQGIRAEAIFGLGEYLDKNNQKRPMYNLTKEGVLQLAARYEAVVRFRLIEEVTKPKNYTQKELLLMQLESLEKIERLENENGTLRLENKIQEQQIMEMKPKATYYDLILQNPNLLTTRLIASDYGMTPNAFNKMLHDYGIQYKQSNIWFLYREYAGYGYTQTKTQPIVRSDGTPDNVPHMYWTQKGRMFLYDFLKNKGVVPVIEQEERGA